MKATEKAWLAGIIDGDGMIGLYYQHHTKGSYWTAIVVAMTHKETIYHIKKLTGIGSVRRLVDRRPQNKPCYQWCTASKNSITILEAILPYLVTKKKQAIVGLKYAKHVTGQHARITFQERRYRLSLWRKMQKLNRRGIKKGVPA